MVLAQQAELSKLPTSRNATAIQLRTLPIHSRRFEPT
jgi:hypothetical protein